MYPSVSISCYYTPPTEARFPCGFHLVPADWWKFSYVLICGQSSPFPLSYFHWDMFHSFPFCIFSDYLMCKIRLKQLLMKTCIFFLWDPGFTIIEHLIDILIKKSQRDFVYFPYIIEEYWKRVHVSYFKNICSLT